ncbi:RDD family protein [Allonocardiopsis opalescens]|uniref:Putative RDD family membrane protein YckC n=1 Tax=Allonocardiopsis opalescens TaxID=1144618 RepID=A0A2T0PPT9_9ACTN|nr:RDD family protein [Allonocardiopsis opalescens]PRX90920.1 putative RDD family membrane protein YckC [Allonocardiopsis opalescens]
MTTPPEPAQPGRPQPGEPGVPPGAADSWQGPHLAPRWTGQPPRPGETPAEWFNAGPRPDEPAGQGGGYVPGHGQQQPPYGSAYDQAAAGRSGYPGRQQPLAGDQGFPPGPPPGQPFPGRPERPQPPGAPAPLAEWWERLVARLLDGLIVSIPGAILYSIITAAATAPMYGIGAAYYGFGTPLWASLLAAALWVGVAIGYEYYFLIRSGQTVGKTVMRLRVVALGGRLEPTGIEQGAALRRAAISSVGYASPAVPVVGLLFGLFAILDGLFPLWDAPYRQTLHDKAVRTIVVRLPEGHPTGPGDGTGRPY